MHLHQLLASVLPMEQAEWRKNKKEIRHKAALDFGKLEVQKENWNDTKYFGKMFCL